MSIYSHGLKIRQFEFQEEYVQWIENNQVCLSDAFEEVFFKFIGHLCKIMSWCLASSKLVNKKGKALSIYLAFSVQTAPQGIQAIK